MRTLSFTLAIGCAAAAAGQPQPVRLNPPNNDGEGYHGWAVAGMGDINEDGWGDAAVSAIGAKTVDTYAGAVQIFSGASGNRIRTIMSPNRQHHGRFGWSVSAVPDVNGDGFNDLAVGAPFEQGETGPEDPGRAYVYSGRTGQLLRKLRSPMEEELGLFGTSIAGIGDVNGDGRGDVIVGAPREDPGQAPDDVGRVHLYSGATGVRIRTLASPNPVFLELFGFSVASVPDMNGDSRPDILVGAPMIETEDFDLVPAIGDTVGPGRAYLFSGASGQLLRIVHSPSQELGGGFGRSVSGIPDVNGDGRGDVVGGAPFQDPGESPSDAGRAYVFSGATAALLHKLIPPSNREGMYYGFSVAGSQDLSGDGRGDVVVGARRESSSGNGRAHLYSGSTGVRITTLLALNDPNIDGDGYGSSVASMPDSNGNGRPEVLVGAPFEEWIYSGNSGGWVEWDYEGRAYLFKK